MWIRVLIVVNTLAVTAISALTYAKMYVQAGRAQPIQHRRQSGNGNNSSVVPQPIRHRRQTSIGNGSVSSNGIQRIRQPHQQVLNFDRIIYGVCGKVFVSADGEYICSKRCRDRLL